MKFAQLIDQTLLSPVASSNQIIALCHEAIFYTFRSVCVSSANVKLCSEILQGSPVKISSVAGFPHGNSAINVKLAEAAYIIESGGHDVDTVINIGKLLEEDFQSVTLELLKLRKLLDSFTLKIIIETCYLNRDQILNAVKICTDVGVDYIKTSTGYGTGGAQVESIKIIRSNCPAHVGIKASGGISDYKTAKNLLHAGADILGTSKGIEILKEIQENYKF